LYTVLPFVLVLGIVITYLMVRANRNGKFDKSISQSAVKHPYSVNLLYPLFVLLGFILIACVFMVYLY
jgi:hypothetical protein